MNNATESVQFTFISPTARETYNVIGRDRTDVCETAFDLARNIGNVRAVIAKPIHFAQEPMA